MKRVLASAAALYLLALALRVVPLFFSTLPFNIDGFPLARISEGIVRSGQWRLDDADPNAYNLKLPGYSLAWAAVAAMGAIGPLVHLQVLMPVATSLAVPAGYALALRLVRHRGAAFAAGLVFAVLGSFVFLTAAIMKESLGLLLFTGFVLLFLDRADPRRRMLAAAVLLVLPVFHHLTTLLALGVAAGLVAIDARASWLEGSLRGRALALDILTGPGLAIPAFAYYRAVDLPFFRDVFVPSEIALFLSLAALFGLLAMRWSRPRALADPDRVRVHANRVLAAPAAAVALIVANRFTNVFPATGATRADALLLLAPLSVLGVFAVVGFNLVRSTENGANRGLVALLLAPLDVILFAFLRGLDPLSFALAYRTADFLDFGLAIAAGVGLVFLVRSVRSRAAGAALAAALVAALLATLPMAYESERVFGVENVTTPDEFLALRIAAGYGGVLGADQRLADIARSYFGVETDPRLPLVLRDGGDLTAFRVFVLEDRWTSVGAQVHPAPNVVLAQAQLDAARSAGTVVYEGGPPGDRVSVVLVAP